MQKITTAAELKSAILLLENKQASEWPLLKEHFLVTYESFNLINIIKRTFKEVITSPEIKTDVVNATVGLSTGIVAKKILIGKTHNPLRKILGIIVELAIANTVSKNADGIKSIGNIIFKKILNNNKSLEKI